MDKSEKCPVMAILSTGLQGLPMEEVSNASSSDSTGTSVGGVSSDVGDGDHATSISLERIVAP